jgi:murein DD-endopeptidase MepM/ murein hydrolase activator NlpD
MTALVVMGLSLNIASAEIHQQQQGFVYPVETPLVSSVFGHIAEIRNNKPHHGIDFRGAIGTPVFASATGKVLIADSSTLSKGYGLTVVIQHAGKTQTLYAHLDKSAVKAGQAVSQGQVIGYMGETGKVTGPHLHFEMSVESERVDPTKLLRRAEPISL